MRSIGSVSPHDVDFRHDRILQADAEGLPKVTRLMHHYKIHPGERFVMKAGYQNFDPVKTGDVLAQNEKGDVTSPVDGLILMPKYQSQGDDGFFIVEALE
jgi:succinylglutamate desuccinylase